MLTVNNLSISFTRYGRWLSRRVLHPIKSLDLDVPAGEVTAVVGESGAGKSLLAHAVLGLLPANARIGDSIRFNGEPLTRSKAVAFRGKRIALIPQSVAFLNPLRQVGNQVRRAAVLSGRDKTAAATRTAAAFRRYGLDPRVDRQFPFELSGGMARRVLTAAAVVGNAELIIADEPTTGLDTTCIERSLSHLKRLADQGKAVLLITHDIGAAIRIADRVAVFKDGKTLAVEKAENFKAPERLSHPYARQLFYALPENGFTLQDETVEEVRCA
ncbi:MAG: ATP-binding cassette domain-containing protein [Desulfobacterales bacterium]|nr:ATP-binding cassette domain-containing protein [Desulfobacterales bacterium]